MNDEKIKIGNLMSFLLGPFQARPGMYVGEAKISKLPNFIAGYMVCLRNLGEQDSYFDNPGFISWFHEKYNKAKTPFWTDPFLEEAKGDEEKALQLYLDYVLLYAQTVEE